MTWFSLVDMSVCACRKIALMSPSRFQRYRSSSGVLFLYKFVFPVSNLMWWFGKKKKKALSEQCIIPLEAERCAKQAKCFAAGHEGKKLLFFLLGEMSKPKRHSINYSPSLLQSDILITTGGGYRVSARLQSSHDRGSNSNMFAAKKYGSVWCVSCPQGIRMNGNNSSWENATYFLSHFPWRKDKEITSLPIW